MYLYVQDTLPFRVGPAGLPPLSLMPEPSTSVEQKKKKRKKKNRPPKNNKKTLKKISPRKVNNRTGNKYR